MRAETAFASRHGSDAPPLLLKAAKRFEALDLRLARETYRDAFTAARVRRRCGVRGEDDEMKADGWLGSIAEVDSADEMARCAAVKE